jgi:ectoine hydroxylase-related dioxygenase (phytanoyl-CoA dioxygenase family)
VSERLERRWLATDLRAGDVVFHSPHIVHASLDATTDEPRLSTDIRFIPVGDAADPRWSGAWSGDDGY